MSPTLSTTEIEQIWKDDKTIQMSNILQNNQLVGNITVSRTLCYRSKECGCFDFKNKEETEKNNKHTLILNLKLFNKHVTYKHFKMDA